MDFSSIFKRNSRTYYSILNFVSGIFGQVLNIAVQVVVRTVFIKYLGKAYLGIGGLFSNILSMLSLVDLGIGNAILYKLYAPIKENDEKRIIVLMKFYKKIYTIIGFVVLAIGISLIPFLDIIVKDAKKINDLNLNLVVIYLLYLLKSVCSYLFFAYKCSIIKAHQKQYIITVIEYFVTLFGGVIQIVCLLLFNNYMLYITIYILEIVCLNICCAKYADKKYAFINNEIDENISEEEEKEIYKDCLSISLYKTDSIVNKASTNVIISMFIGIDAVGLYSNYHIFYQTIKTLFDKIYNAISNSLGNLHAYDRADHANTVFCELFFLTIYIGGVALCGIYVCADELVSIWIGEDWIIKQPFSLLLGIEIFTLSLRTLFSKYRSSLGLFRQSQLRPIASIIINIFSSVLLVGKYGISGVVAGTLLANWLTAMWIDPYIIYKYGFNDKYPIKEFFKKYILYIFVIFLSAFSTKYICGFVTLDIKIIQFMVHVILCIAIPSLIIVVLFHKNEETQFILDLINKVFASIFKKKKK